MRLRELIRWNSLATQVLAVATASLLAFTTVLLIVVDNTVRDSVEKEIQSQVEVAQRTASTLLGVHGGTPVVIAHTLQFGGWIANEDIELVNNVKKITGCDATIYQIENGDPIAISTTMQQNGKPIIGSELTGPARNAIDAQRPYRGRVPFNGQTYIAAYEPIIDDSGHMVGVLFTAKPATALSNAASLTFFRVAAISLAALVAILALIFWFLRFIRRDA
ncbi:MAG: Cache 3/Cache 2 fusion domain-containing protein, partial [Vulcanimicrobiaceae bacterium]